MKPIIDPDLYKRMCEPFSSPEAAQKASDDFFLEVRKLREKFGIPDVMIITRMSVQHDEGAKDTLAIMSCGDSSLRLPMLLQACDQEEAALRAKDVFRKILRSDETFADDEAFSALLIMLGAAQSKAEAQDILKSGKVLINQKPIYSDGMAPVETFELSYAGMSVKIPGFGK